MKNLFLKLSIVILFLTVGIYAQEKSEATLIDEFGKICSEDLMARYDNLLIQLQNEPSSKGYIIFNGENSQEGTNILYSGYVSKIYPSMRGYNLNRLVFIRGKNSDTMQTKFWIVPDGAKPPEIKNIFQSQKINSTTRFQETYAELFKYPDSGLSFVNGFYDLGCNFAPNLQDFAKILLSDDNLTGYLIIYGSKKQAKKIKNFSVKALVKTYKVPQKRLKTIYGERREEAEIEIWFVPNGDKPPTPNKRSVSKLNHK